MLFIFVLDSEKKVATHDSCVLSPVFNYILPLKTPFYSRSSVGKLLAQKVFMTQLPFWTPGLPEGVVSNRPCPLVRPSVGPSVGPSLNISETVHWFFPIFCIKLEHHKGTKVTEPDV